jgi:catechol 2,3-dioxygenase
MNMATTSGTAAAASIHPDTTLGSVHLTVSELERSRQFYERAIGLSSVELEGGAVGVGAAGAAPRVVLHGDPSAPPLSRRATGLFHLAILVPSREDLAFALARLADARWPLDGASDHLVSEALYLSDPDGNGIEIYRDRPREEWPRRGGQLEMATLPLDLDGVISELSGTSELQRSVPLETRIGHVHLQVAELAQAEQFYSGLLGFDVMVRGYPGALFVSAGGYHHHLGLNTWNSAGASAPVEGSIGLRWFEIELPSAEELEAVAGRLRAAGVAVTEDGRGILVRDPSGIAVLLRAR